jgi:xylulokinase
MFLLGFDIGSSSVKASLVNAENGTCIASAFYPKEEMPITAVKPGWAEQDPEMWWQNLTLATKEVLKKSKANPSDIKSIGISYQMHGLVLVDKNQQVLRPSIIWCDSRAVSFGDKAFNELGKTYCLDHLLNSPGNFTASKLKWIKDNEPVLFDKIYKIMLPGDYIAMRLSGTINSTISGLSEGMFWDIKNNKMADFLLTHYGIGKGIMPDLVSTFSEQSKVSSPAAKELGLTAGTVISYRAGDQPNNALSLNVLNPGEIAATAGTSGVVYGISDQIKYDPQSRVNTFVHVNHTEKKTRLGVLLCINGTGILNSWMKKNVVPNGVSYDDMNRIASEIPIGSNGLAVLPFGNGAERMLGNKNMGAIIAGTNFNTHHRGHLLRASQEGIVFSFKYGMDIMHETGIKPSVIRAGNANMFLSSIFRNTLANVTGATIELYDTDGSVGAAKGAGIGAGIYKSFNEAFSSLKKIAVIEPSKSDENACKAAYENWKKVLTSNISS